MKKLSVWLFATLATLMLVACANQKEPAQQAIAQADSALSAIRDSAQKYVPEQLQVVDSQLAALKDNFAKGQYQAVITNAPAVVQAINGLKDSAAQKQQEAEAALAKAKDAWSGVSTDVPKMVDAIQSRVDVLSKSHHLPKNVTKESLAAAKTNLDSMKQAWSDASNAASSGDYTTAMSKAQAVKDQATQTMQSLGMNSSS
jgi:hypothetical protein